MTKEKKTAIQNEQQSDVIINEIIKIFKNNNLTIAEAKKILYMTDKQLDEQKVSSDMYSGMYTGSTLPNYQTMGINTFITRG